MNFFADLDAHGQRTAVVEPSGRAVSYAELLAKGDRLAAGVGRRCLVLAVCSNRLPSVYGYAGFLRAGIVPILAPGGLDPDLLNGLIESYRPAYVLSPEEQRLRGLAGEPSWRGDGYALRPTGLPEDYGLHEDLALLLTTSGSTGSPKLVRQSYGNIASNTASIIEYLKITPEDRAITTLPMHYTYGLSIINTHLAAGAALILTESALMEKGFWALLKDQRATTFGGVPYVYEILKKLRFQRMDLPSLRYLTQAGGRLSPELQLEFSTTCRDKGLEFIIMYGQTEATARMSWLPWEHAFAKAGSIGVAIPGGRLWLADADGRPIEEPETVGELVYDGPNVTLGYAEGRADLAKSDERGGRLFTGDMARFDCDGFFYIAGRKKRFLKLFGSRINLDELEGLLNKRGHECVCAGRDDELTVYLTEMGGEKPVVDFLTGQLGLNRAGFRLKAIDAIPRSEAGKVLYADLP